MTQKALCGGWDLNPLDIATTGTWSLRVCQFRHLRVLGEPQLTKDIIQQLPWFVKTFFHFLKKILFTFLLTFIFLFVIILSVRGSVGTGRRARLRILWHSCRVGSSPIFRRHTGERVLPSAGFFFYPFFYFSSRKSGNSLRNAPISSKDAFSR